MNEPRTLRRILQHADDDTIEYTVQTLKNNGDLLTPELLDKINDIVTREGLAVPGKSPGDELAAGQG